MDRPLATPDSARRRPRWAGRILLGVAVVGSLTTVGCKQFSNLAGKNPKEDLLEAELRTREREILELRAENANLKGLVDVYGRGAVGGPVMVPGPVLGGPVGVMPADGGICKAVTLGTGTGGRDDDGLPGDELLQVVISPKDADGTAVKVPGRAVVTAMEFTPEGQKIPIGRWDVTPEQLRKSWKGGLLGSGYFLPLQWDLPPVSTRVRVAVVFVTNDGKQFESDRDVTVKPLPGVSRPTVVTPPTVELPKPGTVLPPPDIIK